jgi:hypothetical protein
LIEHRNIWFKRLQNLFDNRPDEFNASRVFNVGGICGIPAEPDRIYENPELWVKECLENLAGRAQESYNENRFCPPCIEGGIYGVHFIDSIFGSEIFFQDGQWYSLRLKNDVGTLEPPDLGKSETWRIAKRTALEFVRQEVALPLFGLPTIASTLNIAVNLYGEEILACMLTEPELAMRDLKIINNTLREIHAWYRSVLPARQLQPVISWERTQPPGYGQICGCTTQLVSEETYKSMIAPLDDWLLAEYPGGGMIHLCGSHEHLIPVFRGMAHLKSVQLNDRASIDLEAYYNGLRQDQIIYLIPCENMTIEQAVEITDRNRLVIVN